MSTRNASEQRRARAPAILEALEARRLLAATLITPVGGSFTLGTTVDASAAIQDVDLDTAASVARPAETVVDIGTTGSAVRARRDAAGDVLDLDLMPEVGFTGNQARVPLSAGLELVADRSPDDIFREPRIVGIDPAAPNVRTTDLGNGFGLMTIRDGTGRVVGTGTVRPGVSGADEIVVQLPGDAQALATRNGAGDLVVREVFPAPTLPPGTPVTADPVGVAILTPAAPAAVLQGDDFDIAWAGGDADTTLQLWAAGPFGWRQIASSVPADAGRFAWDTSDAQGWHAFGAWVNDSGTWRFVASPDWVNVVNPANRPPQVELLAPAGGNDVIQGVNVVVSWRAFDLDGDPLRVNVLAWSAGTGFVTLASDADRVDSLSWDTSNLPPGTYVLRVEAFDGAAFAYDFTGAPIEIIQAPGTGPIFVLQTPNAASQVRRGETFQVLWSFFDPGAVAPRVQIWAFHQQLGWFQVADVDARLGQFALPTTTLPAGTYTFGAWVFSDGFWTEYAAEDTLEILPAAVI